MARIISLIIGFLLFNSCCFGATELVFTIKEGGGGDYTALETAVNANESDLVTANTTYGCGWDNKTASDIADGAAVTWNATADSGTLRHMSNASESGADTFLLQVDGGSEGNLADNDVIDDGAGNTITVDGTPYDVQITFKIDGSWSAADTTQFLHDGYTTDATHFSNIYTTATARHSPHGIYDASDGYALEITDTISGFRIADAYVRIDGLQVKSICTSQIGNIYTMTINPTEATWEVRLSDMVFLATDTHENAQNLYAYTNNSGQVYMWNSVITRVASSAYANALWSHENWKIYSSTIAGDFAGGIFRNNGTVENVNVLVKLDTDAMGVGGNSSGNRTCIENYTTISWTNTFNGYTDLEDASADGDTENHIIDSDQNFLTTCVGGEHTYSYEPGYAYVVDVVSDSDLEMSADICPDGNERYRVRSCWTDTDITFQDAGNYDYRLPSGELAIDRGTDTSGYPAPMNFTDDIDGNTRAGTMDIGAWDDSATPAGVEEKLEFIVVKK